MPIHSFLSKENVLKHKEYLKNQKLLYSVLEKSYPRLSGLGMAEISRLAISPSIKREAIELKSDILLHELFFSSFTSHHMRCKPICQNYGSEANFLYEIECMASTIKDGGFVVVYLTGGGEVAFYCGKRTANIVTRAKPVLAIDLYEHAYFGDYGFDRKRYLKNALAHLDLSKITDFAKNN